MSNQPKSRSISWIAPVLVLVLIAGAAWYLLKPVPQPIATTPVSMQPAPVVPAPVKAEPADKLTPVPVGEDGLAAQFMCRSRAEGAHETAHGGTGRRNDDDVGHG